MFSLQPNQKRLLSSFNPLIIVTMVFVIIVFRTTSDPLLPSLFRQWDALIPFIIYFAQRRSMAEGLILALFTGHLYSLCSSAPIGLFIVQYLLIFTVARILSFMIYANRVHSLFLLMLSMSALSRLTLMPVTSFFGHSASFLVQGLIVGWGILFNALCGTMTYLLLGLVDQLTFKRPTMNIELAEREI